MFSFQFEPFCKNDVHKGQTIFHIDYSKSYKNKQHDEIQSAYFGQCANLTFPLLCLPPR